MSITETVTEPKYQGTGNSLNDYGARADQCAYVMENGQRDQRLFGLGRGGGIMFMVRIAMKPARRAPQLGVAMG